MLKTQNTTQTKYKEENIMSPRVMQNLLVHQRDYGNREKTAILYFLKK